MAEFPELIRGLLDGGFLIALSLSLGGLACTLVVLRPMQDRDPVVLAASDVLLKVSGLGLCAVAGLRVLELAFKALALSDTPGSPGVPIVLQARLFGVGTSGILLALGMAWSVAKIRRDVSGRFSWGVAWLMAGLFMVNEAWLSHAAGRPDNQQPLMVATMVHVWGATVWAGGVVHMLLLRRVMRERDPSRWPGMVARFSSLDVGCVGIILGTGAFLWWQYVGGWAGLIGTGYGNVLLVKMVLFVGVLGLAAVTFLAARQWVRGQAHDPRSGRGQPSGTAVCSLVPFFFEVEILLAGVLLFAAGSLTGFPPAVDVAGEPVPFSEIRTMYAPKFPHLHGPERVLIDAPELTDLKTGETGKQEDVSWDRFNHNVSGVIILAMAIAALLEQLGRFTWPRLWLLMFLGFSALIFVFANPDHWPLGSIGFLAGLQDPEVVQHWFAAVLVLGLGWSEWLVRAQSARRSFRFVFPLLCVVGGMTMLIHSHGIMERKHEFLIQNTHVSIGVLAVLMGCARWLEIRLPAPYNRLAGLLSLLAMLLVGFVLLFYIRPDARVF